MTYSKQKLIELIKILSVKGRNKPGFNELKADAINRLGPQAWERLLSRAKVKMVQNEMNKE